MITLLDDTVTENSVVYIVIHKNSILATILAKSSWDSWAVSRVPHSPNQCWKISRFFQQKGKKSPDYQDWKWGGGENLLCVPTLLSGIVDILYDVLNTSQLFSNNNIYLYHKKIKDKVIH